MPDVSKPVIRERPVLAGNGRWGSLGIVLGKR